MRGLRQDQGNQRRGVEGVALMLCIRCKGHQAKICGKCAETDRALAFKIGQETVIKTGESGDPYDAVRKEAQQATYNRIIDIMKERVERRGQELCFTDYSQTLTLFIKMRGQI
jgi:hypothetical protein